MSTILLNLKHSFPVPDSEIPRFPYALGSSFVVWLAKFKGAIHSTKISGQSFENVLVSNGSRQVRTVSFHSTRKTSFTLT